MHNSHRIRPGRSRLARERQVARVVQVFLKFFSIELLAGLLILVVAQVWSLMKIGEWGTLNWRVAIRAMLARSEGPDEIAIVQIDERSAREWPSRDMVPRGYLAKLVEKIEQANPEVVALDLFLGSPGNDPDGDSLLARVLGAYDNLVLGSEIEPEAGSDCYVEYRPYEYFLSMAENSKIPAIGHTMLVVKNGLAFGRLPIVETPEHAHCPSFALAIFLRSKGLEGDGTVRSEIGKWEEGKGTPILGTSLSRIVRESKLHRVLPINFIGQPERVFKRVYPAYAILNMEERPLKIALADKIVLVGATFRHARDKLFTPVALRAPMDGVEVHANILANYMLDEHIFPIKPLLKWALILASMALVVFLFKRFLFLTAIELLVVVLAVYWISSFAAFIIGKPQWLPVVDPTLFAIGTALFMIFYRSMRVEVANTEIEKLWGARLADSHLLELEEQAVTSERLVTASRGQLETVTVVYLRLHGLLDLLGEQELNEHILLRMVDQFIDVIQEEVVFAERHRGATDRFFGEGMYIFCGVPVAQDDQDEALRGVRIAFELREHFRLLVQNWQRDFRSDFRTLKLGLGVHTGQVVVGAIHNRTGEKEYAILGDTLHIAERLESLAVSLFEPSNVLISEATAQLVGKAFRLRPVPSEYIERAYRDSQIPMVSAYELVGLSYESLAEGGSCS